MLNAEAEHPSTSLPLKVFLRAHMRMVELCVCACRQVLINVYTAHVFPECIIKRHAWIYTYGPHPRGWGHSEWVRFHQIDRRCYSILQSMTLTTSGAYCWTLHTEVDTRSRSWRPRGSGARTGSIFWLKASVTRCRSLQRSESLCLRILLTRLVQESSTLLYIKSD